MRKKSINEIKEHKWEINRVKMKIIEEKWKEMTRQ